MRKRGTGEDLRDTSGAFRTNGVFNVFKDRAERSNFRFIWLG